MLRICLLAPLGLLPLAHFALAQPLDTLELATLQPGQTATQNALWGENPSSKQFTASRRVVIADIQGPATITMIHFALTAATTVRRQTSGNSRDWSARTGGRNSGAGVVCGTVGTGQSDGRTGT